MPETGTVALLHLTGEALRERLFLETGLRAQIAALEELFANLTPMSHDNGYRVRAVPQVELLNKLAALRKELGE